MTYRCDREKKKRVTKGYEMTESMAERWKRNTREGTYMERYEGDRDRWERKRNKKRNIRKGDTIEAKRCERGDICAGEGVKMLDEKI
jgi:hypothetical protein